MTEFAYNNTKNANIGYTAFELNYRYHFWMFYKKNIDFYSKFKSANKLSTKPRELMIIFKKNLYYAQKL